MESDLWKAADEGIIHLGQAFGFGMIRRISQAVGLKQLEETYAEVLRDYGQQISGNLVDLAIKLDHFPDAPISAIKELDGRLTTGRNYYSHKILQDLVYCYLYIRNVDYKTRSQLMSWFKISGAGAKALIENPSKRQKRTGYKDAGPVTHPEGPADLNPYRHRSVFRLLSGSSLALI